jgi:transcription elongation factor GreA
MNTTQDFITKDKKEELEAELKNLKEVKRKEIATAIETARSMGDLSENAEYHQAREEQGYNEERIAQIENTLRNSKIISGKSRSSSVSVGSVVLINKKGEKESKEITIVGHEEVDALKGKIAFDSPLGVALIGKKEGDEAKMLTPKGEVTYKIKEIK